MNAKAKTFTLLSAAGALAVGTFFLTKSSESRNVVTAHDSETTVAQPRTDNRIQVALLLDTSSSMSGLINQARSEMWNLVNELSTSTRDGTLPQLELALYEYGKPALGSETGFVRQISPLTRDLDGVSEDLFALRTNGGDEYAGHAIDNAVNNLEWSSDDAALKIIFIAGNESFRQGPTSYQDAISHARSKGIVVNTIYCGNPRNSDAKEWAAGAKLAMGKSLHIDHNAAIAHIAAPQDAEIARLGAELNQTYLAYGAKGLKNAQRQQIQDKLANRSARAKVARARSKASGLYSNSGWDMVDAVAEGSLDVGKLDADDMPAEMRTMSRTERKEHVEKMSKKRLELQRRIRDLSAERGRYVASKKAKRAPAAPTLEEAMVDTVRSQATRKGYKFKK